MPRTRTAVISAAVMIGVAWWAGRFFVVDGADPSGPPVTLGKLPDLKWTPRPAGGEANDERIAQLIASLAELDRPDFGLSATLSGESFAPLPGQDRFHAGLITNHGLQPSGALKALVALGPAALPQLLKSLDDQTPTKLVMKHEGGFGGMWHAAELDLNPVNPAEEAVCRARLADPQREHFEEPTRSYTLKVGDVCFVAIGQIVGRSYSAVRYQPTACIVLNCPAHDAKLCAEVRSIWNSSDARRKLFDSLRADYATQGVFNGRSLDGWSLGSDLQCAAALRLLYYFEPESAPLIADRLAMLDVSGRKDFMRRCVANGVRADAFVQAVVWSTEPKVRAAAVDVFRRAEDFAASTAALPAIESDVQSVRNVFEPLVEKLPAEEGGPYGDGYHLLKTLARLSPDTSRAVFERYLHQSSTQRCHTVAIVLSEVEVSWDKDVLGPLLTDQRSWGWTYAIVPGRNEPRGSFRVCDVAAVTLSNNHLDLKFTQAGTHADMDRQIAVLREQLEMK